MGTESRTERWKRSWWILLTLVPPGFLSWLAFAYVGISARRWRWLAYAALYLAAVPAGIALPGNWNSSVIMFAWPASVIGAFVIRNRYLALTERQARAERRKWRDEEKPSIFVRSAFSRRVFMPLFVGGILIFGVVNFALAGKALYDLVRMKTAAIEETTAAVIDTDVEYYSRGENEYYVVLAASNDRFNRVRIPHQSDFERFAVEDHVGVRWYGDRAIELTAEDGTRVTTFENPSFEWFDRLVFGFTFVSIGLLAGAGVFAAEERYGSGLFGYPRFLRPRLRHTLDVGEVNGWREYELLPALYMRLVVPAVILVLFVGLPNLWWTPPRWATLVLGAIGVVVVLPQLLRSGSVLRFRPGRLEYAGQGMRISATAWALETRMIFGNPAAYLELADATGETPSWTAPFRSLSAAFGEDPLQRLNVQMFLDAARREGSRVEEALRRDLESGTERDPHDETARDFSDLFSARA